MMFHTGDGIPKVFLEPGQQLVEVALNQTAEPETVGHHGDKFVSGLVPGQIGQHELAREFLGCGEHVPK